MMETIVHNFFSTEAGLIWLVLKWALVVLAAGFIGQFGKAFATHLIRRAREGKRKETVPAAGNDASPAVMQEADAPVSTQAAKLSPAADTAVADDADTLRKEREKEEKKARKDRQKSAKKALKGIRKLFK
jgi:hypothetical protein